MILRSTIILWPLSVCGLILLQLVLPHREITLSEFATIAVEVLLLIQSVKLVRSEPSRKNRPIFVNFSLFFGTSLLFAFYPLIGPGTAIWNDEPYARVYFQEYISFGLYPVLLALAIVYLSVDGLFREFRTWQKYVVAIAIVGGLFLYYSHSNVRNPQALYQTADIQDFRIIDHASEEYKKEFGVRPAPEQVADRVTLCSWSENRMTGTLFPEERLRRVRELFPYLEGNNYVILVFRPLYMNVIYLSVLSVGFILLFFGYQYMKDPPQGAYIERIMFLFLIYCSVEILHAWSFVKSLEWGSLAEVLALGRYVSVGVLLLVAIFFSLRLRFVTSVKGEFYEQELATSPTGVIRWRDALDNLMIRHFFDSRWLPRRILALPRRAFSAPDDKDGSSH